MAKISEYFNAIPSFLRDARTELKKVKWPTRKETFNYTLVVVAISLGVAFFVGGVDYILTILIEKAIK